MIRESLLAFDASREIQLSSAETRHSLAQVNRAKISSKRQRANVNADINVSFYGAFRDDYFLATVASARGSIDCRSRVSAISSATN